jgi:hypothetical protein
MLIPALWEVEMGGWWFQASPGKKKKKKLEIPISKDKLGIVTQAAVIPAMCIEGPRQKV